MRLTGWALTESDPLSRVELVVAGQEAGRARMGLPRPEVARRLQVPHAEVSGFEGLVDLSEFVAASSGGAGAGGGSRGGEGELAEVEIEARGWSLRGASRVVASRTVSVRRPAPVAAVAAPARDRLAGDEASGLDRPSEGALNLVCFTHDLGLGGGQLWLSELLRRASAGSAFECTVVAPTPGPLIERFEAQGIGVHLTGETPVRHGASYEGRVQEMVTYCSGHGYNAALVNSFGAFMGADIATRLGLGTVWAIHESWRPSALWSVAYGASPVDPAVPAAVALAMRSAGALIFEAEETRLQYADAAGPDRAVVVPYGIDVSTVEEYRASTSKAQARQALDVPEDARVLLVLGTTEPRKAQTMLAAAFAQVASEHPDALLVFVGDTGTAYADALRNLVRGLHIEDQVRLVPVVEDVYQWYRAADALVCASDVESLPRSVLEAMAFSVPIVATSVFGLTELLTDGDTGYLFEPLDLGAMVDALRRVLAADGGSLAAVAEAGRQLVLRDYDSAWYAADVVALLEGLRRSPSSTPAEILAASSPRPSTRPRAGG
jgi:glycosyltransferase involved in cell wall biosynthesis